MSCYIFIFWTLPSLCVQSWIEKFNQEIQKKKEDFDASLYYDKFSKAFSTFFFLFYFLLQVISIVIIFSGITKFIYKDSVIDAAEYLLFSGYMLALGQSAMSVLVFILYFSRQSHPKPAGSDPDSGVRL